MTSHTVDIDTLPPQVRDLVEGAARAGEIVLTSEGEAVAKIVPMRRPLAPRVARTPGSARGLIHMVDEHDEYRRGAPLQ
jgi:antitoxin (DNA-binding transcriptional repressor) of toxin-antitoxin stability system